MAWKKEASLPGITPCMKNGREILSWTRWECQQMLKMAWNLQGQKVQPLPDRRPSWTARNIIPLFYSSGLQNGGDVFGGLGHMSRCTCAYDVMHPALLLPKPALWDGMEGGRQENSDECGVGMDPLCKSVAPMDLFSEGKVYSSVYSRQSMLNSWHLQWNISQVGVIWKTQGLKKHWWLAASLSWSSWPKVFPDGAFSPPSPSNGRVFPNGTSRWWHAAFMPHMSGLIQTPVWICFEWNLVKYNFCGKNAVQLQ